MGPQEAVRIIMRFTDHTSNRWPYMFHCHTLRHEDNGMMGQFLVFEPGQPPATEIGDSAHGAAISVTSQTSGPAGPHGIGSVPCPLSKRFLPSRSPR